MPGHMHRLNSARYPQHTTAAVKLHCHALVHGDQRSRDYAMLLARDTVRSGGSPICYCGNQLMWKEDEPCYLRRPVLLGDNCSSRCNV